MGKIHVSLRLKTAKKHRQKISSEEVKGIFLWIGGRNVVDWIIGYRMGMGFIAYKAYHTGNHWIKDLYLSLFRKDGFVRLTRFI